MLSAQSFTQLVTDQNGDDYSHSLDVTEFASALSVKQDSIFDISGSGPSDVIPNANYIELVNGTPLGEEEANVATSIYPDPARGYITVAQRGKVEIYDITGMRRMTQMMEANQQLDLRHLPKGVYIFNQNGASVKFMKE
ncbi:T9SS type A sorting domain-containing protein [Owenweeksia hongkongensis]|uniref:T9SS type A sorting domain-containing protein n=1 Tax=Owenweeksia hongkongensis TaxID=253245 RepID=UPI003A91F895